MSNLVEIKLQKVQIRLPFFDFMIEPLDHGSPMRHPAPSVAQREVRHRRMDEDEDDVATHRVMLGEDSPACTA